MKYLKFAALFALICGTLGASLKKNENEVIETKKSVNRCFPDEWEGNLFQAFAQYDTSTQKPNFIEQTMKYHVSHPKKLVAAEGEDLINNYKFKLIQDYNKLTQYTIVANTCSKMPIKAEQGNQCLADDWKFTGTYYQGAGDNKININAFSINAPGVYRATFSITPSGIPIGNEQAMNVSGIQQFEVQGFSNVTLKVSDPSVFDVPAICNQVVERKVPFPHVVKLPHHKS